MINTFSNNYKSAKLCNIIKQLLHPDSGLNLHPTPTTLSDWRNIIDKNISGWVIIEIGLKTKQFFDNSNYGIVIPYCKPYNLIAEKKSLNIIPKLFNTVSRRKVVNNYILVLNYNTFFDILDNHILSNKNKNNFINFLRNKYSPSNFWIYVGINNQRLEFFENINKGELIINNNFIENHNKKKVYEKIKWEEILHDISETEESDTEEEECTETKDSDMKQVYSYDEKYDSNLYRLVINEISIIQMIEQVCINENIGPNVNIFNYLSNLENDILYIFEKLTIK